MTDGDRAKASKDALKAIYFVLIGLAIRESLVRVFVTSAGFRGMRLFNRAELPTFLLLCAFLPTVSRIVHGASIHLDDVRTHRFKPLVDFVGFLLQASMFYVMALSIEDVVTFNWAFGILLAVDAAWILLLIAMSYITFDRTSKQWFGSNLAVVLVLVVIGTVAPGPLAFAGIICVTSLLATVADYFMNREFYFPKPTAAVYSPTA